MKIELIEKYNEIIRKYWIVSRDKDEALEGIQNAALYVLGKPERFLKVQNKVAYLRMLARSSIRDFKKLDSRRDKKLYYDSEQSTTIIEGEEFSFVDSILVQNDLGQITGIEDGVDLRIYRNHIKSIGSYNKKRGYDVGELIHLSSIGYSNKELGKLFDRGMDDIRYSLNYFKKRYGLQSGVRQSA